MKWNSFRRKKRKRYSSKRDMTNDDVINESSQKSTRMWFVFFHTLLLCGPVGIEASDSRLVLRSRSLFLLTTRTNRSKTPKKRGEVSMTSDDVIKEAVSEKRWNIEGGGSCDDNEAKET